MTTLVLWGFVGTKTVWSQVRPHQPEGDPTNIHTASMGCHTYTPLLAKFMEDHISKWTSSLRFKYFYLYTCVTAWGRNSCNFESMNQNADYTNYKFVELGITETINKIQQSNIETCPLPGKDWQGRNYLTGTENELSILAKLEYNGPDLPSCLK